MATRKLEKDIPKPMLEALPEEAWRDLFGLAKRADREFGEKLVTALNKIDRGLLPPSATHPYQAEIAAGRSALPTLLAVLEGPADERPWFDALDAVAHICFSLSTAKETAQEIATETAGTDGLGIPDDVYRHLRAALKRKDLDADQLALVQKTLAIARDPAVLSEQLHRLADPDPGVVATAARLLGLGRYRPAARILRELVSPERFFESRAVIWALGELQDPDVLPALYRALAQAFRVVDCCIAIGKIGQLTSVGELSPMIVSGAPEQRDAAYRALAMILDHHRHEGKPLGELFATLKGLIEAQLASGMDLSGSTRFHMLLCLARMGHQLDPARVRRYLNLGVDDDEASAMAAVFTRRR